MSLSIEAWLQLVVHILWIYQIRPLYFKFWKSHQILGHTLFIFGQSHASHTKTTRLWESTVWSLEPKWKLFLLLGDLGHLCWDSWHDIFPKTLYLLNNEAIYWDLWYFLNANSHVFFSVFLFCSILFISRNGSRKIYDNRGR